jgi:hypothetical protein
MFYIESKGSFKRTESFLRNALRNDQILGILNHGGLRGVLALRLATPVDTGKTANSWDYEVKKVKGGYTLTFTNSDLENGFPVAIMLQYGHGTGSGGFVQGIDYINPAIQPIFDQLSAEVWEAVIAA